MKKPSFPPLPEQRAEALVICLNGTVKRWHPLLLSLYVTIKKWQPLPLSLCLYNWLSPMLSLKRHRKFWALQASLPPKVCVPATVPVGQGAAGTYKSKEGVAGRQWEGRGSLAGAPSALCDFLNEINQRVPDLLEALGSCRAGRYRKEVWSSQYCFADPSARLTCKHGLFCGCLKIIQNVLEHNWKISTSI